MGQEPYKPRPDEQKPKSNYGVTAEEFCKIWSKAKSIDEVVAQTGMPERNIISRVSSYRKRGIKLKKMPRQIKKSKNA